jgi:hypothetical protein
VSRPPTPYLSDVAERVAAALDDRLVGVWLVGSGALRDFDPRRSDIDVQAVATGRLPLAERRDLAARLEHAALPVPARGLEFVLYARDELAGDDGPRFQLNLNTGPRMDHHVAYEPHEDPGFWFVIDTSITRQHAVPLLGSPAASAVFPEPPRERLHAALVEAMEFFARDPSTRDQAVLSACRAWAWGTDGTWRSKGESARWAISRLDDPAPVARTLRRRDGERAAPPTEDEVAVVLAASRSALAAARG